jgi:hypothetical protein
MLEMRILYTLFIVTLFVGCTNNNHYDSILLLKDGIYEGSFNYDTLHLWESLGIKKDCFVEYASGGVMYQKYPKYCLTKGTYAIIDDSIYFNNIEVAQPPNGNIANYEKKFLLMGTYFVENYTDSSIVFWRIINNMRQEYDLKLLFELK